MNKKHGEDIARMDPKKLTTIIVSAVIGVIMLVTIAAPVVSDAQVTLGPETTINNEIRTPELNYTFWDGSDIELSYTTDGYSVNGELQNSILNSTSQRIAIASNVVCCRIGGNSIPASFNTQVVGWTQGYTTTMLLSIVDGVASLTIGNNPVQTVDIDWLVYADENGTYNIGTINTPTSPFYTSNTDKIVILGNIYTTGDNDTFYAYYDGELTVNDEYADVSSVEITRTLSNGYTDIYDTSVTVTVGDESFTPYFILAPKTVSGHEASGSLYSMVGIIPIVIAIGIVIAILGMIFTTRNDY